MVDLVMVHTRMVNTLVMVHDLVNGWFIYLWLMRVMVNVDQWLMMVLDGDDGLQWLMAVVITHGNRKSRPSLGKSSTPCFFHFRIVFRGWIILIRSRKPKLGSHKCIFFSMHVSIIMCRGNQRSCEISTLAICSDYGWEEAMMAISVSSGLGPAPMAPLSNPSCGHDMQLITPWRTNLCKFQAMNVFESLKKSGAELNSVVYNTVLDVPWWSCCGGLRPAVGSWEYKKWFQWETKFFLFLGGTDDECTVYHSGFSFGLDFSRERCSPSWVNHQPMEKLKACCS